MEALAGDPPAGPGVSTGVFPTRDPRPSSAAVILRLTEGPAAALAGRWCGSGRSPDPGFLAFNPGVYGPAALSVPDEGLRGRATPCPADVLDSALHPFQFGVFLSMNLAFFV